MATITEDYVSFEIAKLLKEKGFNGYCNKVIAIEDIIEERFEGRTCAGEELIPAGTFFSPEFGGEYETYEYSPDIFTASAPCPTIQMAMKWLRETHNIHIEIYVIKNYDKKMCEYTYTIMDLNFPGSDDGIDCCNKYKTYEEACEAAIKYYLEKMILKI